MQKTGKSHQYYKTLDILGVKVDFVSLEKALSEIEGWEKTNKKYQISTPNPEQIILAQKDYRFRKILNEADLRIADGIGVVWAARQLVKHQRTNLCALRSLTQKFFSSKENFWQAPRTHTVKKTSSFHRLAGIDLMVELCKLAAQKGWRVFLLGGKNNVAQKAAERLKKITIANKPACAGRRPLTSYSKMAGLNIESFGGVVEITNEKDSEREKTIEKINKFKPHFLFVAYGAPWQEKWIYDNLPKLNVKVAMGVGGAFDYLADRPKRALVFIRSLGLEWFWRLLHQPWRIRRQLALLKFILLIVKEEFSNSITQ